MDFELDFKDDSGAGFSKDRVYRYVLWRRWELPENLFEDAPRGNGLVAFVGLNPSTADEKDDDPTIRRCVGFARAWGFDGLLMLNLFAYRSTDPKAIYLRSVQDPVGPENDQAILQTIKGCRRVVLCWGTHGKLMGRGEHVTRMILESGHNNVRHFGKTGNGEPRHPLYLRADKVTVPLETS